MIGRLHKVKRTEHGGRTEREDGQGDEGLDQDGAALVRAMGAGGHEAAGA